MFCQQDRAILCRECDVPIHAANEHTQKHNRFLFTGLKLSATSDLYIPSSSSLVTNGGDHSKSQQQQQPPVKKTLSVPTVISNNPPPITNSVSSNTVPNKGGNNMVTNIEGFGSTTSSTISQYLMETLPGWQVEEFLDSPSTPFGFCKVCVHFVLLCCSFLFGSTKKINDQFDS